MLEDNYFIMNKAINVLIAIMAVTLIGLTGCGFSGIPASDVKDPASSISSRETPVTKELGCFGDMLTTYRRIQTGKIDANNSALSIPVAVVSVTDKTGVYNTFGVSEIPLDMTDMAIGSVAKIGGALRLIHIPKNEEYVAAYNAGFANQHPFFGNFVSRQYLGSNILIYGNLTEYDRTLKNYKTGFDGSLDYLSTKTRQGILKQGTAEQQVFEDRTGDSAGISGSYGNIENVSRMTMDFRVVKLNDGGVISNESVVTNTILLYQKANDKSFGVSLNGKSLGTLSTFGVSGAVGYANTMTDVDARHAALRMLIERSVVEALGKTYNLPYWRCLAKEEVKKETTNNPEDNQEKMFVVRPNDPVKLSDESIKILNNSTSEEYQYPNSMMDKNIDLNVISAVKRYFEREDYLNKNRLISFVSRPSDISSNLNYLTTNPLRVAEIKKFIDVEKKKIEKSKIQKTEVKQEGEDWLPKLQGRLQFNKAECGQYYFNEDIYYEYAFPLKKGENEQFNPYYYVKVDTKQCLFEQVISAYRGKTIEQLKIKYPIYGKSKTQSLNSDFFATLWLNIPIELNARWKY